MQPRKKILLFIITYKAEAFIENVLQRIPAEVWNNALFETHALIIDDQSDDQTFARALSYSRQHPEYPITVLHNPRNQGYGGNQKIGYYYAVQNKFDAVLLLHGDGQYPPELIAPMVEPILKGEADAVFGSRMMRRMDALRGGMPLYKWIGNQILTAFQNLILKAHLTEFHTGFRAYSVPALASIPFNYNSNYYDFDTDIIIQLLDSGKRINEIAIPTHYGQEISRVNGFKYAALILLASIASRVMHWGIFYHPKFDYMTQDNSYYTHKFGFESSHRFALDRVRPETTVLDIGCGPGFMTREMKSKGAKIISVDRHIPPEVRRNSFKSIEADLDHHDFQQDRTPVDTILILDIIEHLRSPETFLNALRERYAQDQPEVVLTTGNIAFFLVRLSLLFGQFNYGKRGILDLDHVRLFTFASMRRLLLGSGYDVLEVKGIPAPFPLALGDNILGWGLLRINQMLIRVSKSLFAYQMAYVARPRPTLSQLLQDAVDSGKQKSGAGRKRIR
jgi:glycosyltransferase involved in cell wall biosynthesis